MSVGWERLQRIFQSTSQEKEPALEHATLPRVCQCKSSKLLSICFRPFDLESPSKARDSIIGGRGERIRAERSAKKTDYAPSVDSMMHCPVLHLGMKDLLPRPLEWYQLTTLSSQSLMEITTVEKSHLA